MNKVHKSGAGTVPGTPRSRSCGRVPVAAAYARIVRNRTVPDPADWYAGVHVNRHCRPENGRLRNSKV